MGRLRAVIIVDTNITLHRLRSFHKVCATAAIKNERDINYKS